MGKISKEMHHTSYGFFRKYLDITYSSTEKILGLSTGYPAATFLPLPKNVLKTIRGIDENGKEVPREGYGWEAGSKELRELFLIYENLLHNTKYTMNNICMVAGATYALNRILEYIYTESFFKKDLLVVAPTFYRMLGRVDSWLNLNSVSAKKCNNYQITPEEILNALTKKTKAVFILNPSNPTYLYYTDNFFKKLIPELKKKGIYLIIDESGDAFCTQKETYSAKSFPSILQEKNVIRIVTASKKYLLAEYRVGYVLADASFIGTKQKGFIKLIGDDISNPPFSANKPLMEIMKNEIALLQGKDKNYAAHMTKDLKKLIKNRDFVIQILKKNPYVNNIIEPEANFNLTFSLFPKKNETDLSFYTSLIKATNISILPASGLGFSPKDMTFRLTYALPFKDLKSAVLALDKHIKERYGD